jgi:hypothetical protein
MGIKKVKRWGISFNKLTSSQKAELSRVYTEYAVECIRRDGEGSIPLICAITNLKKGENRRWTVSFLETLQKNLPSIYGGLNPKDALWDEAESPRSTGWRITFNDLSEAQRADLKHTCTNDAYNKIVTLKGGSIPLIQAMSGVRDEDKGYFGDKSKWDLAFISHMQELFPSIYGGLDPCDIIPRKAQTSSQENASSIWLVQSGDIDVFCEMYEIEYFVKMLRPAAIVIKKMKS